MGDRNPSTASSTEANTRSKEQLPTMSRRSYLFAAGTVASMSATQVASATSGSGYGSGEYGADGYGGVSS
jgi:hypothetical protein